jgi:pilus assembly protein CpaB
LKRSNRVILLLGVLLAAAAFLGVVLLFNSRPQTAPTEPEPLPTVYSKVAIPLGTVITADMVETRPLAVSVRPTDAFGDIGLVVGKTVRTDVAAGAIIEPAMFTSGAGGGQEVASLLDPGLRAIAVEVDQTSGVGTLINVGDRVDLLVGFAGADKVPTVSVSDNGAIAQVTGLNSTTVKLLLQGMQVIGTIGAPTPAASAESSGGAITAGQLLLILAVTPQQAEVIKFAQIDGQISVILRSPKDYRDPAGNPVVPAPDTTTGVILKTLIDKYGVLPPQIIVAPSLPLPSPLPGGASPAPPAPAPSASPSASP